MVSHGEHVSEAHQQIHPWACPLAMYDCICLAMKMVMIPQLVRERKKPMDSHNAVPKVAFVTFIPGVLLSPKRFNWWFGLNGIRVRAESV